MGFFSSLFGLKPVSRIQKINRVFITRSAANNDVLKFMVERIANEKQLILVYFFKETKHEIESLYTNPTNIVWVNGLVSSSIKNHLMHNNSMHEVIFVETYPNGEIENDVLNAIEQTGFPQKNYLFFNGLNDVIFIPFGSNRLQNLMIKMGVKEDEPIEHAMISKSIERAQNKLTKKLTGLRIDSRSNMMREVNL